MKKTFFTALLAFAAIFMGMEAEAKAPVAMKAGFASADITPELGIYLVGYGRPQRLATNVHSKLYASVMYLNQGKSEAVVIGVDWCFIDMVLTAEIQKSISDATGIPAANIILCCSHTHSAPSTTVAVSKWRGTCDPNLTGAAYVRKNIPAITEAVKTAKNSAVEVAVGLSAGKTKTGISRRSTHEDGSINMLLGDPNMIYDDNLTVARFIDKKTKETLGIFVHASAHNTAMGITTDISSDWMGVMRDRIQTRYQVPVVFVNGALGDVGPRTNRFMSDETAAGYSAGCGDGVWSVLEVGLRAATDVLELLAEQREFRSDYKLQVAIADISLPQAIHMSKAEAEKILDEKPSPDECNMANMVVEAWNQPPRPTRDFKQTIIAFGPVAIVPYPLEMFSVFSLRLRKYGNFQYTLCASNVNGHWNYMPDRGSIASGGYESACRRLLNAYVFTDDAGDIAVSQSLKALRKMNP